MGDCVGDGKPERGAERDFDSVFKAESHEKWKFQMH
jgi:hypothetical protein